MIPRLLLHRQEVPTMSRNCFQWWIQVGVALPARAPPPPPTDQNVLNFTQFVLENLANLYVSTSLLEGRRPLLGGFLDPPLVSDSALKAYNAMSLPGGGAISLCRLALPLPHAVCP